MKAYEFAAEVMADGHLTLPESSLAQLAGHHAVKVIVLVQDAPEAEEEVEWQAMAAEQLLAGYCEADAVYGDLLRHL